MKHYDNLDNFRNRTHTIQVTLQSADYVGHIAFEMGGNCFGASLLEPPFETARQEDIDRFVLNDCNLRLDEDGNIFTAVLKNPDGEEMVVEWDEDEINDNVVAIEIIDCKVEQAKKGAGL